MIDHGAAIREASASPDQCREPARETGSRRFRIEDTPAGNSRLLYLATAKRRQAMYGGRIVNYRPRAELSPLDQAAKEADLPLCPLCGSEQSAACRRAGRLPGQRRRPHAVRLALVIGGQP